MATTVGLIKGATEVVLGIGEVSIDNFTFKLFYKWSVSLFIAGSVAVCSSQFFGDPVACETADDSVDEEVLNHYCWMYSTFDIPEDFMWRRATTSDMGEVVVKKSKTPSVFLD